MTETAMFDKDKTYQFEYRQNAEDLPSYYTGRVLSEDAVFINIQTIKNETVGLNKEKIVRWKVVNPSDFYNKGDDKI